MPFFTEHEVGRNSQPLSDLLNGIGTGYDAVISTCNGSRGKIELSGDVTRFKRVSQHNSTNFSQTQNRFSYKYDTVCVNYILI